MANHRTQQCIGRHPARADDDDPNHCYWPAPPLGSAAGGIEKTAARQTWLGDGPAGMDVLHSDCNGRPNLFLLSNGVGPFTGPSPK